MSKEEMEQWFKSCEFIENYMKFYSFKDFYENKERLRKIYLAKDIRTKKLYKWYVYSSLMSYRLKCAIWDYLNENMSDIDLEKYLNMKDKDKTTP